MQIIRSIKKDDFKFSSIGEGESFCSEDGEVYIKINSSQAIDLASGNTVYFPSDKIVSRKEFRVVEV